MHYKDVGHKFFFRYPTLSLAVTCKSAKNKEDAQKNVVVNGPTTKVRAPPPMIHAILFLTFSPSRTGVLNGRSI